MTHSFLLRPGTWNFQGNFSAQNQLPLAVQGFMNITWKEDNWFKIVSELSFEDQGKPKIIFKSRGHLDMERKSYTYVLQHSLLGNIEGEGWIGSQSIVQYYWIVAENQHHTGFDTFSRISDNTYALTSVVLDRHNLNSIMEATLSI
ncbi:hypothetical protein Xen7305DRAFT_00002690 [Xenococcus sp. PCC 7305]|uniref:hypothetical protein n=1 Tax=Xenococcus sp. PCC 7305 TaxID=102125 RepID=UPI0002AC5056|nr:hypothetical protein [Xenococcus sp. PCC 7305]ELS00568.1 hypothetical protein Xen7305DRAFT_00002690 [Xenococcus sp. PCC 7305]